MLLPAGVVAQIVMGGLTVKYGLAPGWVMAHFLLSMLILVAAGALAWRARPAFGDEPPAADRTVARAVWALFALGAVARSRAPRPPPPGPHAGASGTGEVVKRFHFRGGDTLTWLVDRHGALGGAARDRARSRPGRSRGAAAPTATCGMRLTRICLLMAAQGVLGIAQYRLKLPAEMVWIHIGARDAAVGRHRARRDAGRGARAPAAAAARAGARRPRPAPKPRARCLDSEPVSAAPPRTTTVNGAPGRVARSSRRPRGRAGGRLRGRVRR